jgi:hypothetical protein
MSKLLKIVALRKGMENEFMILNEWNNRQNDYPLNIFNHSWLKKNSKSNELTKVVERVNSELGLKCSLLLCEALSIYGNVHVKQTLFNPEFNLRES